MEFVVVVTAGGHGAMLGRDCKAESDGKEKMQEVLENWKYLPFFVRPYAGKMLFAPLAGFPFSEQYTRDTYLPELIT